MKNPFKILIIYFFGFALFYGYILFSGHFSLNSKIIITGTLVFFSILQTILLVVSLGKTIFYSAEKSLEVQKKIFDVLSKEILKLLDYAHIHIDPAITIEEKNKNLEEITKLKDKIIELEKTSQGRESEFKNKIETMTSQYNFLLKFIPIVLGVIAILIAIGKISIHTP
jgi:hypothetical protein